MGNQQRLRWAFAVSPEHLLFTHMKYGRRRRVRWKIRHLAPLDGCAWVFEEWVYGGRKVPYSQDMAQMALWRAVLCLLCKGQAFINIFLLFGTFDLTNSWLVVLMFYGPSTHFRSFRACSVDLATLFLCKPPRQLTSTKGPFFCQ